MSVQRTVSLLSRVQRRIWLTGLVASALLAALAWAGWEAAMDAHARRLADAIRWHYTLKLTEDRQAWQRRAERLRAQMEFMRLGELPADARRDRLRAFFTAQGEYQDFDAALIAHADGQPILVIGCSDMLQEGMSLLQIVGAQTPNPAVKTHCADGQAVYWLAHTPLWLGRDGKGVALYGAALDNGYLARLAFGRDRLYLLYDGRVIAASGGSARLNDRVDAPDGAARRAGHELRIALPLEADGRMDGPVLVIHHTLDPLLPAGAVQTAAGLSALGVFLLIGLVLGQGLRGHLLRLAALADGARGFSVRFIRDENWRQALHFARRQPDEICRLGLSLDHLMEEAESRHREQAVYRQTLDMLEEVVVELDLDGRVLRASSAWAKVCGCDSEIVGARLADLLEPNDASALDSLVKRLAQREKPHAGARLRLKTLGREDRWIELRLVRSPDNALLRGVLRDVTQTYLQEQRITHMALHDALTGLPNRILLEDRLKMALRLAARGQLKVALGFIDIDHFKQVNDNLGHKTGDELLKILAQRLRQQLRAGDTLARWGGDEFVVLLPEMPTTEACREVAAKLKAAVEMPMTAEGQAFHVTFSAGFAIYPDDAAEAELLLAHADRAMFHAKAQGRNATHFYGDMSRKGPGKKEVYIQQRLTAAVREERIFNHYQPLVDAASGRVIGVECLARWTDPDLGSITPATFIPMAENLGIIRELGQQVWRRALTDARRWRDLGLDIGLAINLSRRQLFTPYFTDELLADVTAQRLMPQAITLEITESTAMLDVEYAAERLRELKEAGFRLTIDDFGTGYSSLSQLHEISADELKIDSSFVRRVGTPQGTRLVQAIVGMASSLGLKTVAEGVEDVRVAAMLINMGADVLQGRCCGEPMEANAIIDWVRRWQPGDFARQIVGAGASRRE